MGRRLHLSNLRGKDGVTAGAPPRVALRSHQKHLWGLLKPDPGAPTQICCRFSASGVQESAFSTSPPRNSKHKFEAYLGCNRTQTGPLAFRGKCPSWAPKQGLTATDLTCFPANQRSCSRTPRNTSVFWVGSLATASSRVFSTELKGQAAPKEIPENTCPE